MTDALPDLDALAAKAEAAQHKAPGHWMATLGSGHNLCTALKAEDDGGTVFVCDFLPDWILNSGRAVDDHVPLLKYVEAVQPDVVLRLVGEIRRLRTLVEEAYLEGWGDGSAWGDLGAPDGPARHEDWQASDSRKSLGAP